MTIHFRGCKTTTSKPTAIPNAIIRSPTGPQGTPNTTATVQAQTLSASAGGTTLHLAEGVLAATGAALQMTAPNILLAGLTTIPPTGDIDI